MLLVPQKRVRFYILRHLSVSIASNVIFATEYYLQSSETANLSHPLAIVARLCEIDWISVSRRCIRKMISFAWLESPSSYVIASHWHYQSEKWQRDYLRHSQYLYIALPTTCTNWCLNNSAMIILKPVVSSWTPRVHLDPCEIYLFLYALNH